MKAPRSQHEAIVVPTGGPLYQGRAGQTRTERVHLVEPDGTVRSVEVHRVVNVATDPQLKPRVLAGQLHRLEDGRELALAFVYHDPGARKFALVIPPALAHLEMKEWARLMTEVAEDTSAPVPGYVRDGTTVLGLPALELFLESGLEPDDAELHELPAVSPVREGELHAQKAELSERERQLAQREREMAGQEESLVRLAAELTGRESSLQRREESLTSERSGLEAREKELAQREARLQQKIEQQKVENTRVETPRPRAAAARAGKALEEATVVANMSELAGAPPLSVDDNELREVDAALSALGPPPLRRASAPPPLAPRVSRPPPLHPERGNTPAPRRKSAAPPPLHPEREAPPPASTTTGPPPPPEPPAELETLPPLGMLLQQTPEELWLCVAIDPSHLDAFGHEADLLLQLVEVEGHPIVLLSWVGAHQQVARLPLDGEAAPTRQLLSRLEEAFRFQAALYLGGQLRMVRGVSAPRESNARAVLAKLAGRTRSRSSFVAVRAQVLREPPPVRDETMPFLPSKSQPATTSSVLAALQQLERWTEPDKLEQALLLYSVPQHVLEAGIRRLLRVAVGFGMALSQRLLELAISHKLATDRGQLVGEQLAAFRQRIERGQNDLDAVATLRNWERLFAQADELDLEIDPALRPWLERAARESGAPPPELPLSSAELRRDLGDPGRRLDAIRELCKRGHPSAIPPICAVLDELSPDEVAAAVVSLLGFGAAAAQGLCAALGSPSQFVRHACALGLGALGLPHTLPVLIAQLEAEPTPSWAELARAVGDFGQPGLPVVAQALGSSDRRERLMVALAHLANHGCAEDVKSLETDPDPTVALAARQALTRCARMEWDDQAIRGQQPLRDNSPEARFSQVFHAALSAAP